MQVRAVKQFNGAEGMVRPRQVLDVTDRRAAQLIEKGLAEPYAAGKMEAGATTNKMQAAATPGPSASPAAGAANPTSASQAGGPTGKAKPASSSRPARRRSK